VTNALANWLVVMVAAAEICSGGGIQNLFPSRVIWDMSALSTRAEDACI
jgi:hypothetical protein